MRLGLSFLFRLSLLLVIASSASVVRAQDDNPLPAPVSSTGSGSGSITGRVVLPSGHPVNGRVRLMLSTIENPGMVSYSDNNGGFGFRNLREGNYTLEVSGDRDMYEPVTEHVVVNRGMQVVLLINLRVKSSARTKPDSPVVAAGELDQNVPVAAKKEFEKASSLVRDGNTAEAIEHYKRALDIFPAYLMAHNDMGAQYLKLKRLEEAAAQFEAALEVNENVFNPRLNLGIVKVEQKRFMEAIDCLTRALSIDSAQPAVHLYLGIAYLETDDLPAAELELTKAMTLGTGEYTIAHFYRAQVEMKKGDRDAAIRELKTYVASSPNGEKAAQARSMLERLMQQ